MRRSTGFALILALLPGLVWAVSLGAAATGGEHESAIRWTSDSPRFGGWSAIDVSEDGGSFWAVGDRGAIARGALLRENGWLVGVEASKPRAIKGETTRSNLFKTGDAEGISVRPDGSLLVSYEGVARVWRHADWRSNAERIASPPSFPELAFNGSLEAVAEDANGAILTFPEIPEHGGTMFRAFRHDGEAWTQPYALATDGGWRAVGADLGPDGLLYLLERKFLGVGFSSRIRRFDISEAKGVVPGLTVYQSPLWRHANLEGIGTWRDPDGRIRAVMVSDNNFLPVLRTEIVEVVLPD